MMLRNSAKYFRNRDKEDLLVGNYRRWHKPEKRLFIKTQGSANVSGCIGYDACPVGRLMRLFKLTEAVNGGRNYNGLR